MPHQNLLQLLSLTLVVLFLAACGGTSTAPSESAPSADTPVSPTDTPVPPTDTPIPPPDTPVPPTNTPIPPTDTPVPPTATPACEVKCGIEEQQYIIDITCESGEQTTEYHDQSAFEGEIVKITIDQKRTYKNTGNEYNIEGVVLIHRIKEEVQEEDITVTGGVFGEVPQKCTK